MKNIHSPNCSINVNKKMFSQKIWGGIWNKEEEDNTITFNFLTVPLLPDKSPKRELDGNGNTHFDNSIIFELSKKSQNL